MSRFLILMNQYDEALDSTNTALNSAGSGYRENQEYLKSFEAQINMVKNAWTESVIAMRDSGMGDSMIIGLQAGLAFFNMLTSIIDKVGIFPTLIGASSVALLLFSDRARGVNATLSTGLIPNLQKIPLVGGRVVGTLSSMSIGLQRMTAGSTTATVALGALRTTLSFAWPIAAVMALGGAISWVTGKMAEQTQKNKELTRAYEEYKESSFDALTSDRKHVDELIKKYSELEDVKNGGDWDTVKEEEYLAIQQELGRIFPALVREIGAKGEMHLKSSDEIAKEVENLERLYELEQLRKLADSKDAYKEKIKDINDHKKSLENNNNAINDSIAMQHYQNKTEEEILNDKIRRASDANMYEHFIESGATELASSFIEFYSIRISTMGQEVSPVVKEAIESAVRGVDFSNLSLDELQLFEAGFAKLSVEIEKAFQSGDKAHFSELTETLRDMLLEMGVAEGEVNNLIPSFIDLEDKVKSAEVSANLAKDTIEDMGDELEETAEDADTFSESMKDAKDAIEEMAGVSKQHISDTDELLWMYESFEDQLKHLVEGTENYNTVSEHMADIQQQLLGMYPGLASESLALLESYEYLTDGLMGATEMSDELLLVEEQLLALHPHLADASLDRESLINSIIDHIRAEVEANDILLAATTASANGKLTADEKSALSALQAANSKIKSINAEIEALQKLSRAYAAAYNTAEKALEKAKETGDDAAIEAEGKRLMRLGTLIGNAENKLATEQAELAEWTFKRTEAINTLSKSEEVLNATTTRGNKTRNEAAKSAGKAADATKKGSKATKDATEAQEGLNLALEESVFITDQYKKSLESLNLEMARINQEKDRAAKGSKEYQDAIKKEIALLEAEKTLIKEKASAIKTQMSTGNFTQTGIVDVSSGGYNGQFAKEINKASQTFGVSAELIASVIKTESNFNPNAKSGAGAMGLMQLMPGTAKSLGVKDPFNIEQNIMGGTKYLAQQIKAFGGDVELALAAYNAGPGNVKKFGGIPPFKETQNYVKKVIDDVGKQTTQVLTKGNAEALRLLNDFRISSGFGPRNTGIAGASTNHMGTDFAAPAGTSIKSIRDGKVVASYYHNKSGHVIRVEQDDGVVAQYQHMQGASPLKVGQTVKAGQEIGKVGSTGVSSGPHLHLEIKQNGKNVDPVNYLNDQAKAVTASNKMVVEQAQNLSQLETDLNQASLDILAVNEKIRAAQMELVDSVATNFQNKKQQYDNFMQNSENRLKDLTTSSEAYRNELDRQIVALQAKQKYNQEEYDYYKKLIDSGTLSASVVQELTQRLHELGLEKNSLKFDIMEIELRKVNSEMRKFTETLDGLLYEIERSKAIGALFDEGSEDYREQLRIQKTLLEEQLETIMRQRDALQKLILTQNLSVEQMEEYRKELDALSLEYFNVLGAIKETDKAIESSTEQMASNLADTLVSVYKKFLEEKRDMHLKSIDDEMKAEDKKHKKIMDNYREELDQFRKIIQEKISAIDKEESERDYNKEMDKLAEERLEILRKINLLSMDDSFEAKAERKKLQEELSNIDETISEKQHKREVDLRKESLNGMLSDKEEQINKEEKLEIERHEAEKDRIDDLRDYWNQFYIDQLNDERKFAQMKEDIIAGNFDAMSEEFQSYIQEMKDTMPDLENTLDGTMEAVGTSIRQNIIEELEEALRLMEQIGGMQVPGGSGSANIGNPGQGDFGGSLSDADMKVLAGKFINDILANKETDFQAAKGMREQGHALAAEGRAEGSTIKSDMHYDALFATLTDAQRAQLMAFINTQTPGMFDNPGIQGELEDYGTAMHLTDADMKVILGKLLREKMATPEVENSEFRRGTIRDRGSALAAEGRAEGSTIPSDKSYDSIVQGLDKFGLEKLGNYMNSMGSGLFTTDYLQDYMRREAQKIINSAARAETGGYTGEFIGEKLTFLHQKELILNKKETSDFFRYAPILERLNSLISPSALRKLDRPSIQPHDSGDISYEINFIVDRMTGNEQDVNKFTKMFTDSLKRNRGIR